MKSSASRVALALLVTVATAATACSSFGTDFIASGPGTPDASSPGTDAGEGGSLPPVNGVPKQDSGSSGDAAAGAWSPKDLPGLAVWLDSSVGLTSDGSSNVTAWLDQSGNQNKAAPAAPCVAPTRVANSLNGHDTLAFPGVARTCVVVPDSPSIQFGTGDFAIFVVARYSNVRVLGGDNTYAPLWMKKAADGFGGLAFTGSDKLSFGESAFGAFTESATGGLNDNRFRRFGGTRRGTDLEIWLDGSQDSKKTVTIVDVSQVGRPLTVGAILLISTSNTMIGSLAEIVAVKGNITDAQIADLDGYFKTKYAL